jgi:FAD/FMN-containing dehydrogenase
MVEAAVKTADLTSEDLTALRTQVRGPVLTSGDAGYDDIRTVWNAMIDRRPGIIVRPSDTADVIAAVKFAREHELLICIKGGGHNIAGLAVADGAMVLDMSMMRGVWVDVERKIAHAQAGCLLADIDRATQVHGLAAVLGFVSQTGAAGLTLGGGFGYLTRRWGWTADTVRSIELVTADGRLVRASEKENADLFWGLRGGGGNFGVVTGIEYSLFPVGPQVLGGPTAWPLSEAPKVLELYRELAEEAPRELTLVSLMRPAPPAPWLPAEWHGKPIVGLLACWSGDLDEGEKLLSRIKNFGTPVGGALARRPYVQMQSLLDATQPKGRRYYWKSEYLASIEPGMCTKAIEQASKIVSPHTGVVFFQIGGALNELSEEHSPAGNRDARYVLNLAGSWEGAENDAANIAWARDAWNDMREFSTGGNYINFLTEDESPERIEAALGGAMARLRKVKSAWDPENVFRTNRNIKPG